MSDQGQTQYGLSLRPTGAGGVADDNAYQANVGEAFGLQAVIVEYVNGEPVGEVAPIAVQWEFGGASQYLNAYQPTVAAAAPDFDVNLQANPVDLYYWLPEAQESVVPIVCAAEAPDGTWLQEDGELELTANGYALAGIVQGAIQLQQLDGGNTLLSYGDTLGGGEPGMAIAFGMPAGAAYAGYLGAIQLVSSVREFTGQSGNVYQLTNTNGSFVLDASAEDEDYVYGKVAVAEGEAGEYTFDDTPGQQLLPVIANDPITQFNVDETFRLYFVYNGSTAPAPNNDPTQIWFPITVYLEWGWQATVTNDGQNVWTIDSSQATGPTPGAFECPSWQGTVRDVALRVRPRRLARCPAAEPAVL